MRDLRALWRTVHMVGIGGAGMSAMAEVLLQAGVHVTGNDLRETLVTQKLRGMGADIDATRTDRDLATSDVIVYSAAISPEHADLVQARSAGLTLLTRARALGEMLEGSTSLAVTGTHGKTTTTGMIATILNVAGKDPSYIIGSDVVPLGDAGHLGQTEFVVVEADEAFGTFLELTPSISVILNIDEDHLDYYGSMDALEAAFGRFAESSGVCFVSSDDAGSAALRVSGRFPTFGASEAAKVSASGIHSSGKTTRFVLVDSGFTLGEIELGVGGNHNVMNATAAAAVSMAAGLSFTEVKSGLEAFKGTRRRFESRGHAGGAEIVDDYAHHPTEIGAVLTAAGKMGYERIVAIFQPHLYSRTRDLYKEFAASLSGADLVIVTDVFPAREAPIEGVSGKMIVDAMLTSGRPTDVFYAPTLMEAAELARSLMRPRDLVLTLGAGDITTIAGLLIEQG